MTLVEDLLAAKTRIKTDLEFIYSKAVQYETVFPDQTDEIRMFIRRLKRVLPKLWNKVDEIINSQLNTGELD